MWSTFSQFSHSQLVAESLPHDTYQLINITWTCKSYTNIANPLLAYSKHLITSPGLIIQLRKGFQEGLYLGVWERGLIFGRAYNQTKKCFKTSYKAVLIKILYEFDRFFFFFTRVRLITVFIFCCCCLQVAGPVNEGGGGGGRNAYNREFIYHSSHN